MEGCEKMAKTQALDWKAFMSGEIREKGAAVPADPVKAEAPRAIAPALASAVLTGGLILLKTSALVHAAPVAAPVAVAAMAMAGPADFATQLAAATKPVKDVIFGFAHEIYFVFMAWGALEALIGKPQQGFSRMKVSTGAYILLFWVPWIVDQVNKVRPVGAW